MTYNYYNLVSILAFNIEPLEYHAGLFRSKPNNNDLIYAVRRGIL